METLHTILLVLQVIIAITLIGFILIQHGKGANAGAAFGSGASATVFGSSGSGNFLTKTTTVLAILFLGNSLFLAYLATGTVKEQGSLLEGETPVMMEPVVEEAPPIESIPVETDSAPLESEVPSLPDE